MLRALLDTDILSEVIKAVDSNVVAKANLYAQEHQLLSFTSASVYEVLSGLHRKNARRQIQVTEALFAKNEEMAPTPGDYRLAAEINGVLIQRGTPIGFMDPLIAACAIRRGLVLATGNTDHFSYTQKAGYSLTLDNWRNL
ncbi:MAG: PIN domain-containing protein [Capsulimonadaceae bacterium]